MTGRVLAMFAAPRADTEEAAEFLRAVGAWRAVGREVALVEIGRGVGVLGADPGPEAERWLAALAEDGVAPRRSPDPAGDLASADALMLLPDPCRAGTPPVLRLARGQRPPKIALDGLLLAGQVVID